MEIQIQLIRDVYRLMKTTDFTTKIREFGLAATLSFSRLPTETRREAEDRTGSIADRIFLGVLQYP
jgi:hypothetical protein